jgi:hypothetical protein
MILEYFFNLTGLNLMLKCKFINYVLEPNKIFNIHAEVLAIRERMTVEVDFVNSHKSVSLHLSEGYEDYSTKGLLTPINTESLTLELSQSSTR